MQRNKLLETHHVLKMRDVYNSASIISTRQPIYIISKQRIMPRDEHLRGGQPEGNANVLFAKCSICPLQFCFSSTSSCKEGHDLCQGHLDWERRPLSPRAHGVRCRVGARSRSPRSVAVLFSGRAWRVSHAGAHRGPASSKGPRHLESSDSGRTLCCHSGPCRA